MQQQRVTFDPWIFLAGLLGLATQAPAADASKQTSKMKSSVIPKRERMTALWQLWFGSKKKQDDSREYIEQLNLPQNDFLFQDYRFNHQAGQFERKKVCILHLHKNCQYDCGTPFNPHLCEWNHAWWSHLEPRRILVLSSFSDHNAFLTVDLMVFSDNFWCSVKTSHARLVASKHIPTSGGYFSKIDDCQIHLTQKTQSSVEAMPRRGREVSLFPGLKVDLPDVSPELTSLSTGKPNLWSDCLKNMAVQLVNLEAPFSFVIKKYVQHVLLENDVSNAFRFLHFICSTATTP